MRKARYKRMSFEDKFDRKYACWCRNTPHAWARVKRANRRQARRRYKKEMEDEINAST